MQTSSLVNPNDTFLKAGGEMGRLTREFDWSKTSVGDPANWPQSLRTTVSNLLRSKFPMFLWWGNDMIQFYNDAYRPSMGNEGKHPRALGQKGAECWPEIWPVIFPLIQQVKRTGEATWMENQLIPIYRNGKMEDVWWTFSYSLVQDDNDDPGGILVTCMETTEAVLSRKKLEDSQNRLNFALEAGHLGSWEFDLKTLELKASSLFKRIFGQSPDQLFSYESLRSSIHPEDKQRQEETLLRTINTGTEYDIEFRVIWPDASVRWVNLRGQLQYGENNIPECMVGVSLDITDRKEAENKLQESEARFRNIIEQAPVAIALTRGEDFIFESMNPPMLQIIHKKSKSDVLGKRLTEVLPELASQPLFEILQKVLQTGETFNGTEVEAELLNEGVLQRRYFNITYSRVLDKDGIAFVLHMSTDVTEQVLAKKQVEHSESRYRKLFETMDQGFSIIEMIFDDENRPVDSLFLEMNSVFEKQSGFKGAVGKKIREIVPDIEDKWFDVYGKVALTGEPVRFTDGSEVLGRWFEIYAFPAGELGSRRVAVLFTDITERVLTAQKIEASQRSLLTLFDESPVGIATLSADDALVFETANAFYGGLVGRAPGQLIGKPLLEALPEIKGQGFEEILKDVIASGKPFTADEAAVTIFRNGKLEKIYVNLTYQPRKEGETVNGVLVVATDVTEQVRNRRKIEESETKFRSLIQEAPFATVLYTGPELTIDTINEAMLQLWDKPASVVGKTFEQALPELKGQPFTEILKNVYRTGKEYIAIEESAEIMIQGQMRQGWYKFNYKPIRNEKGEVYGIVHMAVEVTEQVMARHQIEKVVAQRTKELAAANETLQQINKELQRSNAHLEEFAHAASHDLKEPVRKIQVFTSHLKSHVSERLNDTEAKVLSRIENSTQRMGALIDDLLLYSHVSQRPLEKQTVDLNEKLQRVLEDLELDIEEKKAIVHVATLPIVKGYERQLQQLFQNLVSNSLKYSKEGVPPEIHISAETTLVENKQYHVIKVADNGIGFENEYYEKIFQMFSRLHGRHEYSGTGVGLAIVKKVIENHAGLIQVESVLGEGSVFSIYLPASSQ